MSVEIQLSLKKRIKLGLQQVVCYLLFPLLYVASIFWMKYVKKYKIKNIKAVRKAYKEVCKTHPNGLLICPNHLTYLDSMLLTWAFGSPWHYAKNFHSLSWNLPKAQHVKEHVLYRIVCYLGKCLPLEKEVIAAKDTMNQASFLLQNGHHLMVFPEGTRSYTGRINDETYVYGVGQLHIDSDLNNTLFVYMRGENQEKASKLPQNKEQFTINLHLQEIISDQIGRRAMRDVAGQMIETLKVMEAEYIAESDSCINNDR